MNSLRVLESRHITCSVAALLAFTGWIHSAQAQGLVEGAGITGASGSAAQGAAGMGSGLGNMFGRAGEAMNAPAQNTPASPQAVPSPATPAANTAPATNTASAPLVYPLAGLARRDAELIIAAYNGDTPAVRRALAKGANVNVRDRVYTWTPLMWASQNGHVGTVRYLLQKGANVNAKSNDPRRPVMLRVKEYINEQNTEQSYLVQRRVDGVFAYNSGITPLMLASAGGYAMTMRELLARGAQVGTKSVGGETPLMCASASGYLPAVKLLLTRGAKVNDIDSSGSTPLVYAVMSVNQPVVRELLAHGADATLTSQGSPLYTLADGIAQFDSRARPIAVMLRNAAARQKRVVKRSEGEKPVRKENPGNEKPFPKAKDARPFDDGVMILR